MLEESKTIMRHNYRMRHVVSLIRDGALGFLKLPYNRRDSKVQEINSASLQLREQV